MKKLNYIFLSGIHGVGKSTLLRRIKEIIPIDYSSVSDLIRQAGENIDSRDKYTKKISENQNLWKKELKKLSVPPENLLVLDGHFALINKKGEITILPSDTFSETEMTKIILKKEIPTIIQQRLLDRDGILWDIEQLTAFQDVEEREAKKFASDKSLPLFVYESDDQFHKLLDFIGRGDDYES
ncbi:ATP-binding protein [Candidatus Enterococcus leclercqii]|uniref:ATP-binding protein n=1 Tax=Candidatus Enterococcus leclercqii TaxID=1857218 RepID=UPI001379B087|nr:ATP-binding protein [Enterococcus sp. CU9D]